MENNKNPFSLKENADPIKHLSLDSLVAKREIPSYSSPNYAQELIDSLLIETTSNQTIGTAYWHEPEGLKNLKKNWNPYYTESKTNSSRATFFQPILDNTTTFSPAPNSLFVTSQEELSQNAWKLMLEVAK